MVRISDIQDNKVLWTNVPYCDIKETDIETYLLRPNDILFARTGGTVGKSFLVTELSERAIYAGYLIRTRYSESLCPQYLKAFMESRLYWEQLQSGTIATAQPNCNGQTLAHMLLPLPSLAEQKRIVARIEELLPYVERYSNAQDRLDNLNNSIGDLLKKSILQEAIQGKLVPQIESEGAAQELLEQIKVEKQRLVKDGKLKKSALTDSVIFKGDDNRYYKQIDKRSVCIDEDIPFEIPDSWVWVRLNYVADIYTGNSISETEKNSKFINTEGRYYIGTKDVGFNNQITYNNGVTIPKQYEQYFKIAPNNSVLMCIEGGSAGRKIAILNQDVCFGNKLCCFAPYVEIGKYIYYYLQSPSFIDMFNGNKTGIIGGVSIAKVKEILIPLPPQQELQRIVLKIEEITGIMRG